MINLKICGITDPNTALHCAKLEIKYLGLNFVPNSPRQIDIQTAQVINQILIQNNLRNQVKIVLLVKNMSNQDITKLIQTKFKKKDQTKDQTDIFDIIQLHGTETIEQVLDLKAQMTKISINLPIWKAIDSGMSFGYIQQICQLTNDQILDNILLDSPKNPDYKTGKVFQSQMLYDFVRLETNKSLNSLPIIAGGINTDNIQTFLTKYTGSILDICGGAEDKTGRKDLEKIKTLVAKFKTPSPNHS